MMSAQSLASFCCSRKKRWCSCAPSQPSAARIAFAMSPRQRPRAADAVDAVERDQPPQRRVDAAEIPEVRLAPAHVDELRHLPVGRLMRRERLESGRRCVARAPDPRTAPCRWRRPRRRGRRSPCSRARPRAATAMAARMPAGVRLRAQQRDRTPPHLVEQRRVRAGLQRPRAQGAPPSANRSNAPGKDRERIGQRQPAVVHGQRAGR